MDLLIETRDAMLVFDLLGTTSLTPDQKGPIPGSATIVFRHEIIKKALDVPKTFEFALQFGSGVAAGVVANWLYGKLKGRATTLLIDRKIVEIEEGEIKRVIEEKISLKKQ